MSQINLQEKIFVNFATTKHNRSALEKYINKLKLYKLLNFLSQYNKNLISQNEFCSQF
jgi:hypothetical protein